VEKAGRGGAQAGTPHKPCPAGAAASCFQVQLRPIRALRPPHTQLAQSTRKLEEIASLCCSAPSHVS
jgi:hypothetical protein